MSAPEFARLMEIVHDIAPIYDLNAKNCYWFALLIFLVVRNRTGGTGNGGEKIKQRGKLGNYKLGGASASIYDEGGVPNHDYESALRDLQVSCYHPFIVPAAYRSRPTQKFMDKMDDPDQARRLMQERIAKLEKDKER
jgi:hypothetical protein